MIQNTKTKPSHASSLDLPMHCLNFPDRYCIIIRRIVLCFRCRDMWEMHLVYQGGVPEETAAEQASVHARLLRRGHSVHEVPR